MPLPSSVSNVWDGDSMIRHLFANFSVRQHFDQGLLAKLSLWRGGILADEMGLGKTLSMIALIASDHEHDSDEIASKVTLPTGNELNSTLVVVPLNGKNTSIDLAQPLMFKCLSAPCLATAIARVCYCEPTHPCTLTLV